MKHVLIRRFIVVLVAGCMLGYGNAWALSLFHDHPSTHDEPALSDTGQDAQTLDGVAHHCHASAHLLAFAYATLETGSSPVGNAIPATEHRLAAPVVELPYKPPRL